MHTTSKKKQPKTHFNDWVTLVTTLATIPQLAVVAGALHVTLTRVSAAPHYACDTAFVNTPGAAFFMPGGGGTRLAPAAALEELATQLGRWRPPTGTEADAELAELTDWRVDAVRAYFLVLLFKDGRVRRLVMGEHDGHRVMRTAPLARERLVRWYQQHVVGVIDAFVADLADPALAPSKARRLTADFVHFMARWWSFGTVPPASQ